MQVIFEKLYLVPSNGSPFDLTDLVSEVNVYQSLFDHYMYCDIVVEDSIDLTQAMPQDIENMIDGGFGGGEMMILQYASENNPTITNVFGLYERSARTKVKDSTEAYILSGVSMESFETFPKKVSQAYGKGSGNKISDMMKSLIDSSVYNKNIKELYETILTQFKATPEKKIHIEETVGAQSFIIPNLTVDDTIEFFCNESASADYIPQFFFYENYYGYHFRNLGSLVKKEPVMTYYYTEFNTDFSDKDQTKIISYNIEKESNLLENVRDGLYRSRTINLDILKKEKKERIFEYDKYFDRFNKLQPFKNKGNTTSDDANVTLITSRTGHDCQCMVFKAENHLPKKINEFLAARRSYTKHIFNTTMSITVPGTTAVNVGSTVYLNFPRKNGLVDGDVVNDKQLSGKYIVTKVRNKFDSLLSTGRFITTFECVKDTEIMED